MYLYIILRRKIMYKPPSVLVWEFTNKCNLYCIHCGSECSIDSNLNELTTEEALNLCQEISELKPDIVTITGGEPFLRPDWMIIMDRLNKLDVKFTVMTNGTLLDEKLVEKLLIVKPSSVGVSIDGGTADVHDYIRGRKGSFNKTLNAMNLLLEAGVYTTVNTTLQRINVHQVNLIKDIILLYGIDAWKIQMAYPHGRMDKKTIITENQFYEASKYIVNFSRRYKNIFTTGGDCFGYYGTLQPRNHWNGCHAGINSIGVLSNGDIKGCTAIPCEIPIEGNIREKSLIEIWNNSDAFSYNRKFKREMLDGYCSECKYGEVCRGGCTERAYSLSGNPCNNPYCNYKFEQTGFSSEEQAILCFDPVETEKIYNSIRPLPEGFNLNNCENKHLIPQE